MTPVLRTLLAILLGFHVSAQFSGCVNLAMVMARFAQLEEMAQVATLFVLAYVPTEVFHLLKFAATAHYSSWFSKKSD
jgi:hypothetical protein